MKDELLKRLGISQQSATQMTETALQRVTLILSLITMVKTQVIWQCAASRARPLRHTAPPPLCPKQLITIRTVQNSNRSNLLVHIRPSFWPVASSSISCAIGTYLKSSCSAMLKIISRFCRVAASPSSIASSMRTWTGEHHPIRIRVVAPEG